MPTKRSLRPPVNLPAPEQLLRRISAQFWILRREGASHPVFGMSPKEWRRQVDDRIATVRGVGPEADRALIELCKLDPRFLASDLAIAKMLAWKLDVIFRDIRWAKGSAASSPTVLTGSPSGVRRFRIPTAAEIRSKKEELRLFNHERVESARKNLINLGQAVVSVTGRGKKGYHLRRQLRHSFAFYVEVFEEIRSQLRTKFSDKRVGELAQQWEIPEATVRALRGAAQVKGMVDDYIAEQFGISPSRLRGLRTEGIRKKK